jgi:hypothetical protein
MMHQRFGMMLQIGLFKGILSAFLNYVLIFTLWNIMQLMDNDH